MIAAIAALLLVVFGSVDWCQARVPCGVPVTSDNRYKIVGGKSTKPSQWPWQVFLNIHYVGEFDPTDKRKHSSGACGGSIISDEWILTAAHCYRTQRKQIADRIDIYAGIHDIMDALKPGSKIRPLKIKKIIQHEDFIHGKNDLLLIQLASKLKFSNRIRPICLPTEEDSYNYVHGSPVTATGWGLQKCYEVKNPKTLKDSVKCEFTGEKSKLLVGDMFIRQCGNVVEGEFEPENNTQKLCAENGETDICMGDSGGPLVKHVGDHWVQVGVVSHTPNVVKGGKRLPMNCQLPGHPGVFMHLPFFRGWIEERVGF